MGLAKLGLKQIEITKFDKGYFPNKDFDDIPDGGTNDCDSVIWYRSALRPMFGFNYTFHGAAGVGINRGQGIFYFDVNGITKLVSVFADKFYESIPGTPSIWTDRTGAITLTDGEFNHVQFIAHQKNANKYVIGVNGVDTPFKWTGTGNATVLGGSPPNFSTIAKYHDTVFGAVNENVYPSETGDPESWDLTKVISFDKNVKCLMGNGPKLAVLMEDHIGSISGFDYLDFAKEEVEVKNVGCVGRLAACKATFGPERTDVIVTVARDGIWIIDQSFSARKLFGEDFFENVNKANIAKTTCAFSVTDNLLYVAFPYESATENNYLIVIDMITGAVWPSTRASRQFSQIRALTSGKDSSSNNEYIYAATLDGWTFKYDKSVDISTIEQLDSYYYKSKRIDLKNIYQLRGVNVTADTEGNFQFEMQVTFDFLSGDGISAFINLADSSHLLGSTFILGLSTLGGSNYIYKRANGIGGFGRYITIKILSDDINNEFNLRKVELILKRRRMGTATSD